jgi:hypothetical protein
LSFIHDFEKFVTLLYIKTLSHILLITFVKAIIGQPPALEERASSASRNGLFNLFVATPTHGSRSFC